MKTKLFFSTAPFVLVFLMWAFSVQAISPQKRNLHGPQPLKKNAAPVVSEAGFKIPEWGITIDASYDSRLDDFIPGYKIVHVVLSNNRQDTIVLNPAKDHWVITDDIGKKHTAYNHIKFFDKKLWQRLRPELKQKLDYPTMIKPGNLTTLDLFFPKELDLFQFRGIAWNSSFFARKFDVYTNYEKTLNLNAENSPQTTITPDDASPDTKHPNDKQNPSTSKNTTKENDEPKMNFDPSFDDAIIIR